MENSLKTSGKRYSPKQRALLTIKELKFLYPEAVCSLIYDKPYELLFATRLSAQCTDARVNVVTKVLFSKYPTVYALAQASVDDIQCIIKSCGLYKVKARDISAASKILVNKYKGNIPDTMDGLLELPGVGRKTANLIMGDIYKKPAIVTDTHCIRISNKLGLTTELSPVKVEQALVKILPLEESNDLCHRFVIFGREICKARHPLCSICSLSYFCKHYKSEK